MKGVLGGGENGRKNLVDIDQFLDSTAHRQTLPKVKGSRTSESVPPRLRKQKEQKQDNFVEKKTRKASVGRNQLAPMSMTI